MKKPKAPKRTPVGRPRNPHARALGKGPYQPRIEKPKDAYRRRSKHPKPPASGEEGGKG